MNTGVYTITNIVNNKIYVGSSAYNLKLRKIKHFYQLKKGIHPNLHLQLAFDKYGEDNFEFDLIEHCEPYLCKSLELYWMNMLNTRNKDFGYNKTSPITGFLGNKHTEESKKKIAEASKGRKVSVENRIKMNEGRSKAYIGEGNPFYGKTHSEETKRKISETKRRKLQ